MYARIEENVIVEYPIHDIRYRLSDISLPANFTSADLPEGFVEVHSTLPPQYGTFERAEQSSPVFSVENSRWEQGWSVISLSSSEITTLTNITSEQIRAERNSRLLGSDWTQVEDAPVNKVNWAAYRQALRDLTTQVGFPFNIDWPIKPVD